MRKRIFLLLFILTSLFSHAQTSSEKATHGDKLTMECSVCHVTENWTKIKTDKFNHKKTNFPLLGQHKITTCRQCHISLYFSKAKSECSECHKDVHQGTVGNACERCHNTNSWIVSKVKVIHQQSGFPLVGAHAATDCQRCHVSTSKLRFENLNPSCYSCHKQQYYATSSGSFDHQLLGFGTDCASCHNMAGVNWKSAINYHSFFPLRGGHSQVDCFKCHHGDYTTKPSTDCISCHRYTYRTQASVKFPAHTTKYSQECTQCHTPMSWHRVRYAQHTGFEIYTGTHKGKWSSCYDCHNNDATYKANCRKCHNFDSKN